MFQRRIMGLVSYYIGATPDKYAKKIIHYKNITMEPYFQEVYTHYEEIEEKLEKLEEDLKEVKLEMILLLMHHILDKLLILFSKYI